MSTQSVDLDAQQPADSYYCEIPTEPCAIVMFGASGDLARRKLLPALYDLASHQCLAPRFRLIGFARSEMTDDAFRASSDEALPKNKNGESDDTTRSEFLQHLHYMTGNYDDAASYQKLAQQLEEFDKQSQLGGNRLFYLSTPPEVYARIIIEKPFGRDAESARALNRTVLGSFDESQVFRIDHYLGKETVQNLLVFRFGNGIFEPIWNRNYVDYVQITAAETLGV